MTGRAVAFTTILLLLSCSTAAVAARPVEGSVGEVTQADAAALGTVGFRIWSALPGGETNVNDNTSSCRNVRCIRSYIINTILASPGAPGGGGYVSNGDATQAYNGDLQDQPFYMFVDASMNDGAGNHIGFFGVSGVTANNAGVGSFLAQGCGVTSAQNCFERIDLNEAAPPLTGTYITYGGAPNTIRAIGGLNPIPNVRIDAVVMDVAHLSWNDPPTYAGAMRPSTTAGAPPSPVLGVRLWKNERVGDCMSPAGSDPGWTSVGTFGLGQTTTQVPLAPGVTCTFFALTVRLIGPGGLPNEIETSRVGVNSQPALGECTDGQPCTDDFNACTLDACASGACEHQAIPGPCQDGSACTVNDVCSSGVCVGGPPVDCSDGLPCTDDSCVPSTGLCTHTNRTGPCEDGNACTTSDTCSGGLCVGGGPPDCNDGSVCTDDGCSPPTGCTHANNTAPCDDADPCTINDVCGGGACGGTTITVPPAVTTDRLPTKSSLAWDAVPGAIPGTVYDVVRGRVSELPTGIGPSEFCRAYGTSLLSISIPEYPPIGRAIWFLVRARNSCGPGSWGSWYNGVPRFTAACP